MSQDDSIIPIELRSEASDFFEQFQDYMKSLPSINTLNTLILQLDKSLINKNPELTDTVVLQIFALFPPIEQQDKPINNTINEQPQEQTSNNVINEQPQEQPPNNVSNEQQSDQS